MNEAVDSEQGAAPKVKFHPNVKDITGQRFGHLTVSRRLGKDKNRNSIWECICDCGNTANVVGQVLRQGRTKSCGCKRYEMVSASKIKDDISGQRFGRLVAIERIGKDERRQSIWECECDCGTIGGVLRTNLLSGNSTSCGCLQRELLSERQTIHGLNRPGNRTRIYNIWCGMNSRCFCESNIAYHHYGGRGITICEGWHNVVNFLNDMGHPPDGLSINRIDNDKHYSCGHCSECLEKGYTANCNWTTMREQSRNKRTNRNYTLHGETMCVQDWGEIATVSRSTIVDRIENRGWDVESAIFLPPKPGNHGSK